MQRGASCAASPPHLMPTVNTLFATVKRSVYDSPSSPFALLHLSKVIEVPSPMGSVQAGAGEGEGLGDGEGRGAGVGDG